MKQSIGAVMLTSYQESSVEAHANMVIFAAVSKYSSALQIQCIFFNIFYTCD